MAKRSSLIRIVALITLAIGVANLYWVMNQPQIERRRALGEILPLEFFHFPRSLTLLIGFALIISAINVHKRKRRAFHLVLALSSLSVVEHLLKGRDYEQSLLSLVLIGMLWLARRDFTVRSSPPDWRWTMIRLAVAALVALGYGVAGFWLLDEPEFGINFTLPDSIHRTLLYLTWIGDPGLSPRHAGGFGRVAFAISDGLIIVFRSYCYWFELPFAISASGRKVPFASPLRSLAKAPQSSTRNRAPDARRSAPSSSERSPAA
jgi:lysylphosphatidylglycerol synthetase-like protein (DUF2156 family)